MRRFLLLSLVFMTCAWGIGAQPARASGVAGWPLDGHAEVLLAFGASYPTVDGSAATHRGMDLAADPGTTVYSVQGGAITFAGSIPAGEGSTMLAVTVESEGVRLTYMPLQGTAVSAGDRVEAGAVLGLLAASGDRSSDVPHLHIGARIGDLYVDPASYVVFPAAATAPVEPAPLVETAPLAAPQSAGAVCSPGAEAVSATTASEMSPGTASGLPVVAPIKVPVCADARVVSVAAPQHGSVTRPARVSATGVAADPLVRAVPGTESGVADAMRPAAGQGWPVKAIGTPYDVTSASASVHDRRAQLMPDSLLARGIMAAAACVLGVALLWPVWRAAVSSERSDSMVLTEDVAAVVLK